MKPPGGMSPAWRDAHRDRVVRFVGAGIDHYDDDRIQQLHFAGGLTPDTATPRRAQAECRNHLSAIGFFHTLS
jgi:hypothetical protein